MFAKKLNDHHHHDDCDCVHNLCEGPVVCLLAAAKMNSLLVSNALITFASWECTRRYSCDHVTIACLPALHIILFLCFAFLLYCHVQRVIP